MMRMLACAPPGWEEHNYEMWNTSLKEHTPTLHTYRWRHHPYHVVVYPLGSVDMMPIGCTVDVAL